ncbi:MAG TPA: plastocyanin/azurin family copper-binding protein [Roseiflexaceae bacterium]|jgi:plastocyanin
MGSTVVRLLAGALLGLALYGDVLAAPLHDATAWQVGVGGESADHALQAQAFLPSTITIDEGDTIKWTTRADFVHTVSFTSGGPQPPVVTAEGNTVVQPAATAFPAGGPNYDGTGFVNSGLLEGKDKTFSLTFTKAGSYSYVCLLHPGMGGAVVVQPAGSAYPMTQAQVDTQANTELYAKLGQANQDLQSAKLTSKANANGTTNYTVVNGAGGNQASMLRFIPVDLTVKAGDSVTWLGNDPHEVHTVTFYDPAGKVPDFIVPQPQPSGPPKLVLPHAAPENDTEVDSQDLYNSGLLLPGQAYTFSFPKPGVYSYVCVVHAPQGMFGKITVEAAGAPASLPRTGTGVGGGSPLPLLGGALLLLLLGALTSGIWLRRLS